MLNLNPSFEYELGGAAQPHVRKLTMAFLEADLKLVAALDLNFYGGSEAVQTRRNQCRRGHAGAAGQRFAFHSALERPHPDVAPPPPLHEIHLCGFLGPV